MPKPASKGAESKEKSDPGLKKTAVNTASSMIAQGEEGVNCHFYFFDLNFFFFSLALTPKRCYPERS
ncbi:MAG: hypothetical protein V1684_01800, partial [bacterium]